MIKRISEKEIFKTKIFTIKQLEIELDNGKKVIRQILDKGDTSLIVPITSDNQLVLIKEYFPAIDEYQLGVPKTHIFLARNLVESKLISDEMEELEIVDYPFEKFEELITEKKVTEARMIAALYMGQSFLKSI